MPANVESGFKAEAVSWPGAASDIANAWPGSL